MEKMDDRNLFISEALPGTQPGSTIRDIYACLMHGRVLTSLDAVNENRTVDLGKYISELRNKYGIDIKDQWITLGNRKRIKQYFIEKK